MGSPPPLYLRGPVRSRKNVHADMHVDCADRIHLPVGRSWRGGDAAVRDLRQTRARRRMAAA